MVMNGLAEIPIFQNNQTHPTVGSVIDSIYVNWDIH
jgi:hypothetical protein